MVMAASLLTHALAFGQAGAGGSVEGAKAALARFVELSNQQALRSPEARKMLTGEAAERWDLPSFGKLAAAPDKVVALDREHAVGRVQWFGANEYVSDLYFYLRLEGGAWKIVTMRRLALTGMLEDIYLGLKAKKSLTAEEAGMFANVGLILASDAALRDWFKQNREALDKLADLARRQAAGKLLFINDRDEQHPEVAQALKRMHLSLVEVHADGNVRVVIGGMTDNTVGFLHSPRRTPPPISPSQHIWVEEVADGWYLFRTT